MIGKGVSHHRILESFSSAGMGIVYKAEDTELDFPITLNLLSAGHGLLLDGGAVAGASKNINANLQYDAIKGHERCLPY